GRGSPRHSSFPRAEGKNLGHLDDGSVRRPRTSNYRYSVQCCRLSLHGLHSSTPAGKVPRCTSCLAGHMAVRLYDGRCIACRLVLESHSDSLPVRLRCTRETSSRLSPSISDRSYGEDCAKYPKC